jgi:ribosomal protein S4E
LKIKKVLEFKEGSQAFIMGGAHVGSLSEIKGIEITRSTKPNLVMYDGFQTIKSYSFVVGEKKSLVNLPEAKL